MGNQPSASTEATAAVSSSIHSTTYPTTTTSVTDGVEVNSHSSIARTRPVREEYVRASAPPSQQQQHPRDQPSSTRPQRNYLPRNLSPPPPSDDPSSNNNVSYRQQQPNGLVVPSLHPHPSRTTTKETTVGGGGDSPQYGFYVNLTPPSPEMYHSSHKKGSSGKPLSSGSIASTAASSTMSNDAPTTKAPQPPQPSVNPIFQQLLRQQHPNHHPSSSQPQSYYAYNRNYAIRSPPHENSASTTAGDTAAAMNFPTTPL